MFQVVQATQQMQRRPRTPSHTHYVEFQPFHLQPFMIAPVLPGETLKNLTCSGRVITDPLATGPANILPWWHETYWFYVKLRDFDIRDDLEQMLLKNTALPAVDDPQSFPTYHYGKGRNFTQLALKRITEEYFRNEGEAWNAAGTYLNGLPLVATRTPGQDWMDSLIVDGALPTINEFQNPEGERDPFAAHAEAYTRMRAMRMIDMSFNEWLEAQGVRSPEGEERNKPELLRYARNWTYPTNVVEPTTGVPSGAVAWSVSERADKDRFFIEPGFIVGVTTCRPKVYLGNQRSAAVSMLTDAYKWLSLLFQDRPESALAEFLGGADGVATGPLRGQTNGYWVDVEDLFRYGDQFIAGGAAIAGGNFPALPSATTEQRWVTQAQINALFATAGQNKIRFDGRTDLNILARASVVHDDT